ncbi:type I polyketide synthase, partial [Streptomyces sp. CHB19.2]|nr:type I polyketide synthase [Streptomyces sp. CHB19.2]
TVMATPSSFVEFSRQRGLAPDGRCKAFSAGADGTGWAEGVGVLVVERLSDAVRLGHRVWAVVRGSAVNQDGASSGLTAPNGPAQQRVIRQALADAGVSAADVDVVEAHGTGTRLGDPIEAQALLATYGERPAGREPLWLGSLKSNIGHTQAAAGVAGVIKMVMALQEGVLPKTLHAEQRSPHVDWSSGAVELLTEARDWPERGRERRAGVSSFGMSGTNAHVVLEQAPKPQERVVAGPSVAFGGSGVVPWVVSGHTAEALRGQAGRLAEWARAADDADTAAVAGALVSSRSVFEHRAVVLGSDPKALLTGLEEVERGTPGRAATTGTTDAAGGGVVLVFPGQGSQWLGMGRELYASSPVFAARVDECAGALAPFVEWSLVDVLCGVAGAGSLDRVDVVQPVSWAVMVGLAAVWESLGVVPGAVVGHSQGEIAAAVVSGALSLEDGARVVALRSRVIGEVLAGRGGMVSVAAPAGEVRAWCEPLGERVSVAAVNGPASVVVSGEPEALDELVALCGAQGVRVRRIAVDYASHSVQVEQIAGRLEEVLAGVSPRAGGVPVFSTVEAAWVDGGRLDAGYWVRNLRRPVRFEDAVRGLVGEGFRFFVECSAHPVLTVGVEETAGEMGVDDVVATGTLRREEGGLERLLTSAAEVFVRGAAVDWSAVTGVPDTPLDLPTYAFQRRRYWVEMSEGGSDPAALGLSGVDHPLLGAATELADDGGALLTGRLSADRPGWLADHRVGGTVVVPGTALVEMVARAGEQVGCVRVEELVLHTPLVIPADGVVDVQIKVGPPDDSGRHELNVFARRDSAGPWARHAGARVAADPVAPGEPITAWPPAGAVPVELGGLYERLAAAGLEYGPAFRGVEGVWRDERSGEVFTEVRLAQSLEGQADQYLVHPALLDTVLHAVVAADLLPESEATRLPFSFTGVTVHAVGASLLRVRLTTAGPDGVSLAAWDVAGDPVLTAEAVVMRPVSQDRLRAALSTDQDSLFQVAWQRALSDPAVPAPATWGLLSSPLGARSDLPGACAAALRDAGAALHHLDSLDAPEALLPDRVLALCTAASAVEGTGLPERVRTQLEAVLGDVQSWLARERPPGARLVVVTRCAVSTGVGEPGPDPVQAAVWGLVRSAQTEHPQALQLIDLDNDPASMALLTRAASSEHPQLAVRAGEVRVPRLVRAVSAAQEGALAPLSVPLPAASGAWRLRSVTKGRLDGMALVPCADGADGECPDRPLAPHEVRVAVRAAGLNFRDVLIALDMYPGDATLGSEAAGVITEVGSAVTGLAPGERVMGVMPDSFGSAVVADSGLIARIPESWSFTDAAAFSIVFLTAHYALTDLAKLQPGETVLVHAGAGGVGMAAVQLARLAGAEVFASAGPGKRGTLRSLGLDDTHIVSSRDLEFEQSIREATGGRGVDVVLNSLSGKFVDASLRLLAAGGRLIELGKTDPRSQEEIAVDHPGVRYRAFELLEAGSERIQEMFTELFAHVAEGALRTLPTTAWDMRRAPEAFSFLSQARHVGKLVLTVPRPIDPEGTVLITGGTGTLGTALARHLAATHGVRHLLLTGRQGPEAAGVDELRASLAEYGATLTVAACDVTDRAALTSVIAGIPSRHPLRAVVHAAGVLDDAVVTSLDAGHLDRVLAPKADGAVTLHDLTRHLDLDAFVLFSSFAGTVGSPGQGNYAAASAFLDAFACRSAAEGTRAVSLAWGFWADSSAMTGHLEDTDRARIFRGGLAPLTAQEGLALFDAALATPEAQLVPVRFDTARLADEVTAGTVPRLLERLAGTPRRRGALVPAPGGRDRRGGQGEDALRDRLIRADRDERAGLVMDVVQTQAALVLGHAEQELIGTDRAFKDLGFDSLTAVEFRNRLKAVTGLRLPATLVFDHPSPRALTAHLCAELAALPGGADSDGPQTAAETDDAGITETADIIDTLDAESLIDLAYSDADS